MTKADTSSHCCPVHMHEPFWENSYTVAAVIPDCDETEECAFHKEPSYTLPDCARECKAIVKEYSNLFSSIPGKTNAVSHHIPTAQYVFHLVEYLNITSKRWNVKSMKCLNKES